MHTPTYSYKQLYLIESGMSFLILLIGLCLYLREIGYLVTERENKNLEHMQIMGVKKITYYFSSLVAIYLFAVVISLIYCIFIKIFILIHVNFLLIYLHMIIFFWIMITWAYLLAALF